MRKLIFIAFILTMLFPFTMGCAATTGLTQDGIMGGKDGTFRVFTNRTEDKMGINTASTFVVKDTDKGPKAGTSDLVYANTAGQPGIGKTLAEQVIPGASTVALGTTAGVLIRPGQSTVQGAQQFQGQITGQQQGQIVK